MNKSLWKKSVANQSATIRDAFEILNRAGLRIVLVIDSDGVLLGTVSDGDIRRGLLNGLNLESSIKSVLNSNSVVVTSDRPRWQILELMSTYKVQQIPVVDSTHRLIDLHLYEDFTVENKRANTVVIMAGGRGARLYPKTENCPKPLLQISGKPILEHVINRAKAQGFSRFVICIHYLGHMIEEYFGDGERFGIRIEYLREETPLGTAGGLGSLVTSPGVPFIVTNGDVITDISYGQLIDFHLQQNSMATMAVRKFDLVNPFGVVKLAGNQIIGFEEKPVVSSMVNAGVYALNPEALNYLLKDTHSDMPQLFQQLQEADHSISAYPIFEGWMDLGSPEDLMAAESSNLIQSKET